MVNKLYKSFSVSLKGLKTGFAAIAIAASSYTLPITAQTIIPPNRPVPPDLNPKPTPKPTTEPSKLPPPDRLLAPTAPQTPTIPSDRTSEALIVKKFEVIGSTVFSDAELAEITAPYTNRSISIAELFQLRTKITDLYLERGYITSGAYIPEQDLQTGTVKIQIIEGTLEDIKVTGLARLNPGYIQSRIAIATGKPLNRTRLLEALQLLQINPLIESISANLSPSLQPGSNILAVQVSEAKTFSLPITLDNSRTPSVGTDRRQIQLNEANLTGLGDRFSLTYSNTNGSNALDASYTIPFNPYNGTISFSFGTSSSNVIEAPFNILDIRSSSRNYEISIRQPLFQSTSQDFAIGLTTSHRQSEASLLGGEIPFPSLGSDDNGRTNLTALRFFQEYVQRSSEEVFAARSQLSVGIDAFSATINSASPDGRFLAWRGQAQYVRLLAPETLLFLRADLQLADRPLLSQEQISFGGQDTLRGFRQDAVLTDNGLLLSAEVRIPVLRIPEISGLLQIAPFFDFGKAWNHSLRPDPDPSTLASVGMGLRFQIGDRLTARLDLGIPLSLITGEKRTWQENGFYFSLVANPF
ncbi:ShlB/FhaC/HecB family hemolysin secretion/activation protein [Tumidithrix helvetica]|uniref:ShlB/FhaC/HecB family hemolysin secretion/activation protein n=1 Tax=Tumidithrix helvetica TaxID=3457545 RepID=UPI003FA36664